MDELSNKLKALNNKISKEGPINISFNEILARPLIDNYIILCYRKNHLKKQDLIKFDLLLELSGKNLIKRGLNDFQLPNNFYQNKFAKKFPDVSKRIFTLVEQRLLDDSIWEIKDSNNNFHLQIEGSTSFYLKSIQILKTSL